MISPHMTESHPAPTRAAGERRLVIALLTLVVIARSAVFVFWPQSHFDSDQAVTGLMAKHLSELRAFPVFWYGQSYMLAVEAWLAAPLFRLAGPSVTTLKLPLLAMNIAIVLLLVRHFERDSGLRPALAGVASLFFAVTPPITTALFLTANGGNVEPCLYVLLFWFLRSRPLAAGTVLGIGFLNREFTIYGLFALVVVEALRGTLLTRSAARRFVVVVATAAVVWLFAQIAKQYSSAAGPGTSVADLYAFGPSNNIAEVLGRGCLNVATFTGGPRRLVTEHYPQLFGTARTALVDVGIESTVWQGVPIASLCLAGLALVATLRVGWRLASERRWREEYAACAYLVLAGLFSSAGYVIGRCGEVDFYTMRYELLSVLGLAGLAAWYLQIERSPAIRAVWLSLVAVVLATALMAHTRLLAEYVTHPPVAPKQILAQRLEARRIRYGYSDFWVAYYVTFMTRERVQIAAEDAVRIRTYNRLVDAHRAEAVRISRRSCSGGEAITPAFWLCAP
jgi:hypothetical protein